MSNIRRFEDLICWQKARELLKMIYKMTNYEKFARDYSLRDQLRRAGISVMLNIAEGFGRRTHKEFKNFLFISHGSVSEVQSALNAALDQKYISERDFTNVYDSCDEISQIISGLIKSLK
jgi:four helix bundle protein